MTTAHRPTFDPARGKEALRGPAYHQRLLPAHTQLKYRKPGQGGDADRQVRDLRAELEAAEAAHFACGPPLPGAEDGDDTAAAPKRPLELTAGGEEDAEAKRRRILAESRDIDADDDGGGGGGGGSGGSDDDDDDDDSEEDDDDDDSEDEDVVLQRELERVRRERAANREREERERAAAEQEQRERDIALGNPLLNKPDFNIKRRWDDDVVFKNQARGTDDRGKKKEFVNTTRGGRFDGRHREAVPTASHATQVANLAQSADFPVVIRAPPAALSNPRIHTPSQQPIYPATTTPAPGQKPALAPADQTHRGSFLRRGHTPLQSYIKQSPFRSREGAPPQPVQWPRRLSASRLWNPTNSTPRAAAPRRRRASTPPPPSVPLEHPALDSAKNPIDFAAFGAGEYPLLTLPEQRQSRHSISARPSLQVERSAGYDPRVRLPKTVRHSYDGKGVSVTPSPIDESPQPGPSKPEKQKYGLQTAGLVEPAPGRKAAAYLQGGAGLFLSPGREDLDRPVKLDKGKGKEVMASPDRGGGGGGRGGFSEDLERGGDGPEARQSSEPRLSGIDSAISTSDSSIMGDPDQQPDNGEQWGPQHPCYPHMNPHVPFDSPEYVSTRVIRIRRDWLLEGDLAPTFSNIYPEILDPAGLPEHEFRRIIDKLNGELVPAFSPYSWRNVLDGVLGLVTGWVWDDLGFPAAKSRLQSLERWIEQWNLDMERSAGAEEGAVSPRIVPLRRTGYMTLDIQIPDPEIVGPAPSTPGASRCGAPEEAPVASST